MEIAQTNQLNKTLVVKNTTPYTLHNYLTFSKATHQHQAFFTSLQMNIFPKNFDETHTIPHWKQAMIEELKALDVNHTWDIVQLPPLKRPIGCSGYSL